MQENACFAVRNYENPENVVEVGSRKIYGEESSDDAMLCIDV